MSKKEDELSGFRDFLDGDKELKRKLKLENNSKYAGFELLSFLELESSRLDKQLDVLEEKSYVIKNCDSYERLNLRINREISTRNAEIMRLLYQEDSPMMKSLEELFGSLFSS